MKWNLSLTINGVDYTSRLIGSITVEREQSTAAILNFELAAQSMGMLDLTTYVGKEVILNYISGSTTKLVFKGIVDTPSFNISNKSISFECTDNLQNVVSNMYDDGTLATTEAGNITLPKSILGNLYNKTRWQITEYLASSKPISFDLSRSGTFGTKTWLFNQDTDIEYTINNQDVIDGSVSVKLAGRSEIVNRVDIAFEYRFPQLCERRNSYYWQHPGLCDAVPYPTVKMIQDACDNTGAKTVGMANAPVYPAGIYSCAGGDMIFHYTGLGDAVSTESYIVLLRRYSRDIKRHSDLVVYNNTSIDNIGELVDKESQAIDYTEFDTESWIQDLTLAPFINHSGSLDAGTYFYNVDTDIKAEADQAIEFLVNRAKVKILDSHRKNTINISMPYNVHLDIDRNSYVHVNINQQFKGYPTSGFDKVIANGQVKKIMERFDIESGSCIKDLEIAVFRLDATGLAQNEETPVVAPEADTDTTPTTETMYSLENWDTYGRTDTIPTETSYGFIYQSPGASSELALGSDGLPERDPDTGELTNRYTTVFAYPKEFRIPTFDITTADQEEVEENSDHNYMVVIPEHLLQVQL